MTPNGIFFPASHFQSVILNKSRYTHKQHCAPHRWRSREYCGPIFFWNTIQLSPRASGSTGTLRMPMRELYYCSRRRRGTCGGGMRIENVCLLGPRGAGTRPTYFMESQWLTAKKSPRVLVPGIGRDYIAITCNSRPSLGFQSWNNRDFVAIFILWSQWDYGFKVYRGWGFMFFYFIGNENNGMKYKSPSLYCSWNFWYVFVLIFIFIEGSSRYIFHLFSIHRNILLKTFHVMNFKFSKKIMI